MCGFHACVRLVVLCGVHHALCLQLMAGRLRMEYDYDLDASDNILTIPGFLRAIKLVWQLYSPKDLHTWRMAAHLRRCSRSHHNNSHCVMLRSCACNLVVCFGVACHVLHGCL